MFIRFDAFSLETLQWTNLAMLPKFRYDSTFFNIRRYYFDPKLLLFNMCFLGNKLCLYLIDKENSEVIVKRYDFGTSELLPLHCIRIPESIQGISPLHHTID